MVTVRDSLISAGAEPSDFVFYFNPLEDDSIGHSGGENASGPFTELNPAVLGQSPHRLNVKRCNIVKKAIREAKGGDVHHVCCLPSPSVGRNVQSKAGVRRYVCESQCVLRSCNSELTNWTLSCLVFLSCVMHSYMTQHDVE